jgi:divalent metal cation (Fe/Co/Zn/Cd) transporter
MKRVGRIEFPKRQAEAFAKARRLEWISIAYLVSAATFLYFVMGSSQAMRTSWMEDMISLVPPIAFLISSRLATRRSTRRFPYGMHTSVSVAYLTASLAILAMGIFLFVEASLKLAHVDRTTIGGFNILGTTIWAGWPMLAALAYTGIPSFFLGRAKLKLAPLIHDKALYADAEMNRADWMAESAAAVGVIGVGLGFWWLDPLAAGLVSLDIMRDGARNTRAAVTDLIDETPKTSTNQKRLDPLPNELKRHLESADWVERAEVRMREEGHVFFGEAFVVPKSTNNLVKKIAELTQSAKAFNWRVHDLTIMPVESAWLDNESDEDGGEQDEKRRTR